MSGVRYDAQLGTLLEQAVRSEASDLHLLAGYPPTLRVHGLLKPLPQELLTGEQIAQMMTSAMHAAVRERFEAHKNLDFAVAAEIDGQAARFRANVFRSQGGIGACLRFIPSTIPSFEWMGIPPHIPPRIVSLHGGLVLITGVTGSGKTTTLAGLVQALNLAGNRRIVTIEEPVEYLFKPAPHSLISQREVGIDVDGFAEGLKYSLRQDPDVILCGEIRDRPTAQMAISAAETGHLVLSTLHTQDAKGALTRLIDIFPPDQHQDVRGQLALSLRFVLSQHLLANFNPGERRVLALEILVVNDPVRAAIRLNKLESIETLIQTGRKAGMQTLDDSLATLAVSRRISAETAHRFAKNPAGLRALGVPEPAMQDQ
jgi:twitching motility protein PilT